MLHVDVDLDEVTQNLPIARGLNSRDRDAQCRRLLDRRCLATITSPGLPGHLSNSSTRWIAGVPSRTFGSGHYAQQRISASVLLYGPDSSERHGGRSPMTRRLLPHGSRAAHSATTAHAYYTLSARDISNTHSSTTLTQHTRINTN